MIAFDGIELEPSAVEKILMSRASSEGVLRRRHIEEFVSYSILKRPFREIRFRVRNLRTDEVRMETSFLDEGLAGEIDERDHAILLWRPKYKHVRRITTNIGASATRTDAVEDIQRIVEDVLSHRYEAQEYDDELGPKLRKAQADPIGTIAFIVPRSPGGVRREQKMLEERSPLHAYVLASSLMTNTDPKDVIESAEIGETVFVHTAAGEYRGIESSSTRYLFMENPGAVSFSEAIKLGRPLTRVGELYPQRAAAILRESEKT